ncbi:SulP family inorganic anion transporter [Nocardioides sp. CCNWLW239]|uniref:SulP family inorganic anion transporter n=1 Tax=Nocardioides sp. CCNWLW239 TaxID=3128902 RepID=UPI0030195C69
MHPPSWLLPTMRGYRASWARSDVLAGLATGTVVIPQAMAYATIAGLPVEVGLYTCLLPMAAYGLLGGSRALSVSTTSTIAVLVASTLATLSDRSDAELLGAAFTLTLLVGACLLLMRLARLGSIVESISPATMTGIRIGVGLTVLASQLPALLGLPTDPEGGGFFAQVADVVRHLPDLSGVTAVVGIGAVAVLFVLRRWAPAIPGPLVVVVAGIVLVAATAVEDRGLALIDPVPTGLPSLSLPVGGDVLALLPGAVAIALMSFLETVLVARTNRRRGEPVIDVDRELVATGIGALAGGLTQSLPPAGGFSQSAVNLRSGARTQLSGLVTVGLALLVALFLAPLLADLPRAILAAMVLVAVAGLLDPRDLFMYAHVDRYELGVALIVAALGLTGGMLLGVAVGVGLTLVLVIRAVNLPRVNALETTSDAVLPLLVTGNLYTGNAQATHDAALVLIMDDPTRPTVTLDVSRVTYVTVPLLDMLRTLRDDVDSEGRRLVLVGASPKILSVMRRVPWFVAAERDGFVRS